MCSKHQQLRELWAVMWKPLLVQHWECDGTDQLPSRVKNGAGA